MKDAPSCAAGTVHVPTPPPQEVSTHGPPEVYLRRMSGTYSDPRERGETHAHRIGVVRRQRKVDVVGLVWSVVLSFQVAVALEPPGVAMWLDGARGGSRRAMGCSATSRSRVCFSYERG